MQASGIQRTQAASESDGDIELSNGDLVIVQIFSIDEKAEDLFETVELQTAADAEKLISLIKEYGFEDDKGDHYRFGDAKVTKQGVVVYVER